MAGEGSGTIRGEVIHVEVIRAWPRHHESRGLTLPAGATVAQAVAEAAFEGEAPAGLAVFGEAVAPERVLADGDRVELLRPLRLDPKEARRRRAVAGK
ncbi:RnfH family protein [Sphingomonas sp.]|uniref:RnfH family protein n=1 Tax=Sphingomonas sp. TaxID=28214 RepID=UPI0035B05247